MGCEMLRRCLCRHAARYGLVEVATTFAKSHTTNILPRLFLRCATQQVGVTGCRSNSRAGKLRRIGPLALAPPHSGEQTPKIDLLDE